MCCWLKIGKLSVTSNQGILGRIFFSLGVGQGFLTTSTDIFMCKMRRWINNYFSLFWFFFKNTNWCNCLNILTEEDIQRSDGIYVAESCVPSLQQWAGLHESTGKNCICIGTYTKYNLFECLSSAVKHGEDKSLHLATS